MKRLQADDVYGEEYVTKFGNTISVGFTPEINEYGISQFIATCNICSEDDELWPYGSITVTIRNIRNKVASCGCSITCRYTDYQRKVQINRLCEGTGWVLKGFDKYPVISNQSRAILYDPLTNTTRKSLVGNLIKNGLKDYVRGSPLDIKNLQSTFNEYKHFYPEGTKLERNMDMSESRKTVLFNCPKCEQENLPMRPEGLKIGSRPCLCNNRHAGFFYDRKDEPDTLYLLKFTNGKEVFYKVGRTFNVKDRVRSMYKQHKTYDVEVLHTLAMSHEEIYLLELNILEQLWREGYHYTPEISFHGSVKECFKPEILKHPKIIKTFNLTQQTQGGGQPLMCKLCDKIYTVFDRAPELDEHYFQDPEDGRLSFVTYYYDAMSDQFYPVSTYASYCIRCGDELKP